MKKRLTRSEVPAHLTWNLDDIFASFEAWEQEMAAVAADIPSVTQFKGRLSEGPQVLVQCLEAAEALQKKIGRASCRERV